MINMIVVGGDSWMAPFGSSAIVDETPFGRDGDHDFKKECYEMKDRYELIHPIFLKKAFDQGRRIAQVTTKFKTIK